jgi:NAD(P)-dependent dehydrogenase (short-subunit alcohol dehydrogenase family)
MIRLETRGPEVVAVTGAGGGLGRAIAQEFGRRGARVGLIARGEARLEDARRDIESAGGRALVVPADVADAAAVDGAAATIEDAFGPLDIWVNNAMTSVFSPAIEMRADEYRRVTDVTYLGCVHGTLAALRRMLPRDRGVIVQVGSALAYRSIPLQSAYCGAKHAIVGFTDSVRAELLHRGSRVHLTVVHMPGMNTPQFGWCRNRMPQKAQPVPPMFRPEDCAPAVYDAAHRRRRELLVGVPTVMAVWGQKVLAGWLDRRLARQAWSGQLYDGSDDPGRPDNLYDPVPGRQGADGPFGDRTRPRRAEVWMTTHPAAVWGAALAAASLAGAITAIAGGRGHRGTHGREQRTRRAA